MPHAPGWVWRAPTTAEAASFPLLIPHLKFQGSSTTGSIPGVADLLGRGICGTIKRKALALADLLDIVSEKAH